MVFRLPLNNLLLLGEQNTKLREGNYRPFQYLTLEIP